MLSSSEIMFDLERDGIPGSPVALVIDGEVVWADVFKPSFANQYILSSPTFSSEMVTQDGETFETVRIITGESSENVKVSELLTAVLLSNPLIVPLNHQQHSHVMAGWKHDAKGFYLTVNQNGSQTRLNGDGSYGEPA